MMKIKISHNVSVPLRLLTGVAVLILFICSGGCRKSEAGSGNGVLAVSNEAQKYILEQIAGPEFDIKVLLPAGSDPEMYEPDMRTMVGIEYADAYFTTSTIGFEERMTEILAGNYPDLKIVDVTAGLEQIEGTHSGVSKGLLGKNSAHKNEAEYADGHNHVADPHLLTSLGNVSIIAGNMLKGLKSTYPDRADEFEERYAEFAASLAKQGERMDSIMGGARGKSFVVLHPSMSYFARDYGLNQIALEKDGKEASPRELKERLDNAASASPVILFYEKGHGESAAVHMAELLGIAAYPINFEGADFLKELEKAANEFGTR